MMTKEERQDCLEHDEKVWAPFEAGTKDWRPWCYDICYGKRVMAFKDSSQCDTCPYLKVKQ
jgi:hypothetical protein